MQRPDLLTSWTVTWTWWVVIAVVVGAYVVGSARVRPWPVGRSAAMAGAVVLLVAVLNSPLAVFSHHLFSVHMIVHLLLIMVIPLLLVLAQPIRLAVEASSPTTSARIRGFMTFPVTRFVTSPAFTVPLYAAVLVGTHLTGFQQVMGQHSWVHESETVLYLVTGYLFLLPCIGTEISGHQLSHPVRFVTLLIAMGPDTMVGVVLMLTATEIAPVYSASRMGWGPDPLADQSLAGAIMWFAGDGLMMVLLLVVAGQWIRTDRSRDPSEPRRTSWLDNARREATLGSPTAGDDDTTDMDDDDAALAAYNARLREMHGLDRRS
ncbi:cytochrome c oxidase assembly protein [Williamsia deligens]|uniref:Cytochrome c oxidase assembly protein n=2 Tax=Williamsia deligens TaxID=321325 RepID=A0ABW3G950_9NOCA|nr:cytochrome c oxidase assembly protein [Williamsia deligens]